MMNLIRRASLFAALAMWVMPTGAALADDQINNDGTQESFVGVESALANGMVGSGRQASDIGGDANTGSGTQDNDSLDASIWETIDNANAGTGSQITDSLNSNGGNRVSDDVLILAGDAASVSNSALDSSVSENSVSVSQGGASANSELSMSGGAGFSNMYGVNAIALSSGANSSQNVSVNVSAFVDVTQAP
jgi:hypothetical protein